MNYYNVEEVVQEETSVEEYLINKLENSVKVTLSCKYVITDQA